MKTTVARLTLVCISLTIICVFTGITHAKFVGIWTMDEGEGNKIVDSSGNGNDGELMNEGFGFADGKFGKALSFDGEDNFVKVPDSDSLDITDAITMMAWIKSKDVPDDQQVILGKWQWSGVDQRSYFLGHGPYPWLGEGRIAKMLLDTDGTDPGMIMAASDSEVPKDEWTHIAGVWDGSEMRIYINGELDGTPVKWKGPIFVSETFLELGTQDQGGYSFFNGLMDEVAIANVALSQDDIKNIMKNGALAVSPAGKLATVWGSIKAQNY